MSETGRFTNLAHIYNAGRPGYPPEVADAIFDGIADPSQLVIVDLGAGTGSSSRLLAERGARVFAVEPNASMRAKAESDANTTWIDAPAERTGLDAGSVDVVTAFQAFHWFEQPAVFEEMLRILRPTGRAAVVFYERNESDPFTLGYGELVRKYATDDTENRRANALDAFASFGGWQNVRRARVLSEQILDLSGMDDRVKSSSYLPRTGPESERLYAEVDVLFDRFAKDGKVRMQLQYLIVVGER